MKKNLVLALLSSALVMASSPLLAQPPAAGVVAHEWGTFTSFQTGDGTLLTWKPLDSANLPKFVYNWSHPGNDLEPTGLAAVGPKNSLYSLQRMETPVIYFYTDTEQTVDVTVRFPEGAITEWYPQARQIGPSVLHAPSNAIPTAVNPASPESKIRWPEVRILPSNSTNKDIPALPLDTSGSHYFTARETDAGTLLMGPFSKTYPELPESEKFLFYRGVANFATSLHAIMKLDYSINVSNTGDAPLSALFVLEVRDNTGRCLYLPELLPGSVKTLLLNAEPLLPLDTLSGKLTADMAAALVGTGLFPREATAMVNTWKDSWFQEPGIRVLYALPRAWTDHTLPIEIKPAPRKIVRTMIGRAEIFSPGQERGLSLLVQGAIHGDTQAASQVRQTLKNFGRFSEPALNQVLAALKSTPEDRAKLAALLAQPAQPAQVDPLLRRM